MYVGLYVCVHERGEYQLCRFIIIIVIIIVIRMSSTCHFYVGGLGVVVVASCD